jgi:transcriptional regulator with XRE-family HTH domain
MIVKEHTKGTDLMNTPLQTGELIRQRRKELGLSQGQLAQLLNIQNTTISRWETGEGYPDISILIELTKVLKVTITDLLDPEDPFIVSMQSIKEDSRTWVKYLLFGLKFILVAIPVGFHGLLYTLSLQLTTVSLGTNSWIPFALKGGFLLVTSIVVLFDRIFDQWLKKFVNRYVKKTESGELIPKYGFSFFIKMMMILTAFVMVL